MNKEKRKEMKRMYFVFFSLLEKKMEIEKTKESQQ